MNDPHTAHFTAEYLAWRIRLLATAERLALLGFHATAAAMKEIAEEETTNDAE